VLNAYLYAMSNAVNFVQPSGTLVQGANTPAGWDAFLKSLKCNPLSNPNPPPPPSNQCPTPSSDGKCHKDDLDQPPLSGAQAQACADAVNAGLSIQVRKAITFLRALRCPVQITCANCTGDCNGPGALTFGLEIFLCGNTNPTATQAETLLRHELTHAYQNCVGLWPKTGGCAAALKRELSAYYCAGQCSVLASRPPSYFVGPPTPVLPGESCLDDALWSACAVKECSLSDITPQLLDQLWAWFTNGSIIPLGCRQDGLGWLSWGSRARGGSRPFGDGIVVSRVSRCMRARMSAMRTLFRFDV
jgi:hypothetical protein